MKKNYSSKSFFTAGTLIFTTNGYKPIEEVLVGDYVLTHKGRFKKVLSSNTKTTNQIIRITGFGLDELFATPEARICVKKKILIKGQKRSFSEAHWETFIKLNKEHYIATTPIKENTLQKKINKNYKITLDEKMAYFMGRFLADGWVLKYKRKGRKNSFKYYTYLCCGDNESEEIITLLKDLPFNYNMAKVRTGYKFCIYGQLLCEYMMLMNRGAKNKIIHPDIWASTKSIQKSYIDGYFSGDGSLKNKGKYKKFTSISKKLLLGVKLLLIKNEKAKVGLTKTIKPPTYVIEGRIVNQSDLYDLTYKIIDNPEKDKSFIDKDGNQWGGVNHNDTLNEEQLVYNIEVDEDHSFLASSIIVHD